MFTDRTRNKAIIISVLFHIILVLIAPGLGELQPKIIPKWIEVDFISQSVYPDQVETEMARNANRASGAGQPADTSESLTGDSPLFPAPPLNLPSRLEPMNDDFIPQSTLRLPGAILPDITGKGSTSPGLPSGDLLDSKEMKIYPAGSPPDINWQPGGTSAYAPVQIEPSDFPIEGPVSKRKVIYRPPPPKAVVTVTGTVQLKFWVHPDGTVSKVVPLVRADPELEKTAIAFLKKWRFETIPQSGKDQWGILPIRFKLK